MAYARDPLCRTLFDTVAHAPDRSCNDNQAADLDKHFAAVEIVNRATTKIRVRQNAVDKKTCGGDVSGVMKKLPEVSPKLDAIERSNNNENQKIERNRANRVPQRLQRRPNRKRDIDHAERRLSAQKQRQRMRQREAESGIARPAMKAENIEPPMRPITHRTVAAQNHQSDENVRSSKTNCCEADIGR